MFLIRVKHRLVSIPPYLSVAQFVGYLKGKSALMIFDRHANLKYKYGNRNFWCRGYYADIVGKNEKAIREYIKSQKERIVKIYRNSELYCDPTSGQALDNIMRERHEKVKNLIRELRYLSDLSGFSIAERVVPMDKLTGKIYQ